MSTFHIIEDVEEQINSSVKKNSSVVEHQIEKKRIKTVGNFNSNGTPFATTSTASSAKISVTSTPEGKSVVSSLSMSLERKGSIQYIPRKIPPCIIPAGQSTVIHLDNYTHFMAQRVTTTKTAIKRAEIIGEVQKIVPGSTMSTTCSNSGGSNSGTVGVPDVGLKVILDGVTSSYRNNNKTLDMNKQKMQVSKSGPRKVRGRKNALALECSQEKDFKKMVDIQVIQDDPSSTLKSILKKPKPIRRRKVLKPRQSRKSKVKPKTVVEQDGTSNEEKQTSEILKISSPVTQPSSESKILRPCIYTLQNKKCISEITCQYFHSDFPCKYYYLNLHCPQDFKCQYMHNGPLEPKLMEALRSHILDLLSTKPSVVETHFIQQLHNIEDLTQRLQSFQKNENQQQSCEVIEVIDDDGDEDQVLVIDESSGEVNSNICTDTTTPINSISNPANGSQNTTAILQPTTEKFDIVYQNFKETNTIIDDIDQKLQNLKTTSNMTPNEKIHELQKIYELLKEQEKRLPIYENLNMITSEQISKMYNNMTQTNLSQIEQPHIVLVNPEIVNEIQNSESQENIVTIMDDDDDIECSQATILNVPQESGIEIIPNETLPQRNGIGNLTNEKLTQKEVLNSNNNDMTNLIQENENNINMELEEESTKNIEPILNKTNVEDTNNCEIQRENNEDNCIINVKVNCNVNNEIIENNTYEQLPMESEQIEEVVTQQNLKENLENNPLKEINETENQEINNELNNSTTLHNETLELALTLDEKEIIEGHIEQPQDYEEIPEEESPPYENIATTKKVKRSHIRLRSHIQQNNEEITNIAKGEKTTLEPIKPIKTRRLRLPKPIQKTTEKTSSDECQINADIINKLIQSEKNTETRKESTLLQDVEVPLTQNVILTKRFMKRAKAKLEQQSLLNETKSPANTKDICTNVEQNMMALHSKNNEIENIDVTLLTQTSDDSNSLTPSQDPLTVENYCEKSINKLDNEATTSLNDTIGKTYSKNKNKSVSCETAVKTDSKRRISFENPTSSTASSIKEQFNLGNPHVVLTKLKSPYLLAATQKIIQADSTTTNSNPIVTSSSNLLADNKCTQKRQCTSEYDLDSSLKENKHLKIDNSKSVRKVNFDTRKRTYSSQSNTSREGDFDTDSSDEKLTIADAMQTSSSTSSTSTDNERKQAFEPSLTHVATTHHHADAHQHVHKEQQENESDLRQQIENVSNKSDLQLQIQQQLPYQQKEVVQATTATISTTKNGNNNLPHKQYHQHEKAMMILQQESEREPQPQQYENNNFKEKNQIANTCNPYVNIETRLIQSSTSFKRIDECEKPTSNSSDKYSNESLQLEKENIEYSTYSSLYNKLSSHSTKCQINFEDSTVHITPISSPTYGDDTIASPSPVRKSIDFRMGGEIDGRLTYPPIPYILHEIDLGKIDINKPLCIDKLKKTIQLDPRVFRTHVKKQLMTLSKSVAKTSSNALVHSTTFNTANLSTHIGSSTFAPSTSTMISPYDPRNRTPAVMTDIVTPSMSQQTALTPYNHINAAASTPSSLSSSFIHTDIPNAVPLALQYHTSSQPILQPQQQQTPNMFLYGCLQRSPWYQSLMSTMKIQINQSISQLVRALNNFHRERLLNPELVFDVFKIDCAGELLEIMRNLSIFVDANGIINEQRHVPSFGGRSCCNTMPVNATYSFIQQVLTPNTHCTSMTTASSNYNAAGGGGATVVGPLNVNEPFVSCYVKAPEPHQQKHINECCITHYIHQDDNNNTSSNNSNCNCNCNRNYNNNNNGNDSGCNNNNNGYNRRFGDGFKKPYDNNYNNNGNNNYRSNNQRSTYNNNPRFSKPGLNSPKSNSSPPNSPRGGFDGGSGNGYGGGGGRGFGGGRGGGSSGRFNNNRRFNNFSNNDKYNSSGGGGSSWSSASDSNENRYNNKFENNNNSPTRASSPINSSYQMGSPRADKNTSSPAPANKSGTSAKKNSTDEECWDSDN